jgi:hypothetical protein
MRNKYILLIGFSTVLASYSFLKAIDDRLESDRGNLIQAVQEYVKYQVSLGGRLRNADGMGVDRGDINQLIVQVGSRVTNIKDHALSILGVAERSVDRSSTGYSDNVALAMQKMNKLIITGEMIKNLIDGPVEHARLKLTELSSWYTIPYDELGAAYTRNLARVQTIQGLTGITPETIYQAIGIGKREDTKRMSLTSLQEHLRERARLIPVAEDRSWWLRQMGYVFSDAQAKARYDAWLAGRDAYAAWQAEGLEMLTNALGIEASDIAAGITPYLMNIVTVKAEIGQLLSVINRSIAQVRSTLNSIL